MATVASPENDQSSTRPRRLQKEPKTKPSQTQLAAGDGPDEGVQPPDFEGAVCTDNTLPSRETLRRIASLPVLDREGQSRPFGSLYGRPGERLLVLFVRHFFCGNCQEYLRTLSEAISVDDLTARSARIVVIGCGEPPLIDMYAEAAACPFSIYADPTRQLYDALGMVSTLALGSRPGYMAGPGASLWTLIGRSILQNLRQIPRGLALKGGNQRQVGGEFLFTRRQGAHDSETEGEQPLDIEDVDVTWCHRMKTTRDHAEVDELKTLLGLS